MKKKLKALYPTCFILLVLFSIIGCDKDFNTIESDVISEDNANFDTPSLSIPIKAYNKKLDSVQINNLASNLLGVFNDPAYGQTKASIITQITPTVFDPNFGTNAVIDSVVLTIPYYSKITGSKTRDDNSIETLYALDSLYGNSEAPIKLSIFQNDYFLRTNSGFGEPQRYYSNANNSDKAINSALTESASINFDAQKGDLIYLNEDFKTSNEEIVLTTGSGDTKTIETLAPAFRSKLNNAFWTSAILEKQGTSVLSNPNNFQNYFRGLYFKAESITNDGSMVLLNLADSKANIVIYYSKDTSESDNTRIQSSYTFNFTGNKLNTFINEFETQNGDKILGDESLYLKNVASMAVVDLFDNLDELNALRAELKIGDTQNALINEAQLIIYEDENIPSPSSHTYDRIYAYDIKNNVPLIDYTFDQSTNANDPLNSKFIHLGKRNEEGEDSGIWKYKIRITEHINRILFQDSTNTKIGLVLSNNVNYTNSALILNSIDGVNTIPAASIISPRGTILNGSNDAVDENKRISLKIFFTKPK